MTKTTSAQQQQECEYSRTVCYNDTNHLSVILQMYGSIWNKVLPHCLLNVALTVLLGVLLDKGIDLTINTWGHEFISVIVSFLIVSRCTMTVSLYFEKRGNVGTLYKATQELVQLALIFTEENQSLEAKEWRIDVAYHAIGLLKVTTAMLTRDINAWEGLEITTHNPDRWTTTTHQSALRGHDATTNNNDSLRLPIQTAHKLRSVIVSHRRRIGLDQLDVVEEEQILRCVGEFMNGYYGLRKHMTTPFPFPLVQMSRTVMFVYVYTIPFALLSLDSTNIHVKVIVMAFIIAYGFVGIELVSIELDDPFGKSPNHLPVIEQAKGVMEDIFRCISNTDGLEWANQLRDLLNPVKVDGIASMDGKPSESSPLLNRVQGSEMR